MAGTGAKALPDFDERGNLPPGTHEASWEEIVARFGATAGRRELLEGLGWVLALLGAAGCRRVWLDGSFVTDKERVVGEGPNDYDLAWDIAGVDLAELVRREPALDPLRPDRLTQRWRFGGDLYFTGEPLTIGILATFQTDREGRRKGVVRLALDADGVR